MYCLFGAVYPIFIAMGTKILDHSDDNFSTFESNLNSPTHCTSFNYDISRVDPAFYNASICDSTTSGIEDHAAITPVSFATLSIEIAWGRYTVPPNPRLAPTVTYNRERRGWTSSIVSGGSSRTW